MFWSKSNHGPHPPKKKSRTPAGWTQPPNYWQVTMWVPLLFVHLGWSVQMAYISWSGEHCISLGYIRFTKKRNGEDGRCTKEGGTVDGRNPANQLRLVVYPSIYMVFYIDMGPVTLGGWYGSFVCFLLDVTMFHLKSQWNVPLYALLR